MIRWTDKNDYNRLLYFASSLQHKAYNKKYNSYNRLKFMFWNFIETILFKLKMYFWHREVGNDKN